MSGSNFPLNKIKFSEHASHAASASFTFNETIITTSDGLGIGNSTVAKKQNTNFKEINFPHSLGLLYSAFILLWVKNKY